MEQGADAPPDRFDGSLFGFTEERFEFGEHLFDWVEIGRVWRQEQQVRASGTDQLTHLAALVRSEIVHDDDVARCQCRRQYLFDVSHECVAVDRPVEHERCRDPIMPQRRQERHRFPMAMWDFGDERFTARMPTARTRHVCLGPGFVNKDEARWINPALIFFPAVTTADDVWPVLLDGEQRFF